MATFEDYLKFEVTEAEEDKKQLRIIEKISLSKETEKAIKAIDKDITIIAVAQVYCPDCRATVPFLKKFSDLNSKIKIDYRSREAAKEFFPDADERIKIPTLISYVDGKYNTFWNEFPGVVRKEMDKNPENQEEILKFARIDSDISKVLNSDAKEEDKANDEKITSLFQDILGDKLSSYKVESFKDSNLSAMVVVDEQSIRMAHMKDQFQAMGLEGLNFDEEQGLLINRNSSIIKKLVSLADLTDKKDMVELMCQQIADLAMLANKELKPDQLNDYVDRTNKLMAMFVELDK